MQIYRTFIFASMLKLKAMDLTWCVCWLLVSFLHLTSLPGNNGSNIVEVPRYVTAAAAPAPTLEVPRNVSYVTATAAPAPPLEVPTYITAAVPPDRPSTVPTYITAAVPPDRPSTVPYITAAVPPDRPSMVPTYITAAVPPSEVSSTPVLINSPNLAPAPSKFPNTPVAVPRRQRKTMKRFIITLVSSIGAFFGLCVIVSVCVFLSRKKRGTGEIEEDYLDQMPGMPMRFTYEELKVSTENFKTKLGQGGYGSVFEGTLSNGIKVAVKHLDGLGHVKKSFLNEVKTIGSIHHLNLVRFVGYCAEKSHRFLVYDYMCNGSLDRWIFNRNQEVPLTWQTRKKIIVDIAKGIAYLHEECQQQIVHLDIKPQNILLDENFKAKVADFGLSKLIDRDQGEVITTMKGTPGYMAPEWLSSMITEKVDVYSFGVVVLEIICGRKNLDRSQPEEDMHLLGLFNRKAEEGQLLNIVDKCEDIHLHGAEVVETMLLAAWCLQNDFAKRPSMSVVVKALEGLVDIERNLDYKFWIPPVRRTIEEVGHEEGGIGATTTVLPSKLSGPR
ncbi:G-type lectin S-receptor-like serine/threonine-protein kinase [Actinidia chinensis var. chinensis]|uniref:non-specific serine/threonine protein kinase n=1 Tax=Actinidia chinensis var. chinensis TaxID=1590841 RepID=A0A2R6PR15_ACTCC|nr:G-type lectin S-receptor-like serine/threonine-protein kinase [Actinidia chinensis var. chinensis]